MTGKSNFDIAEYIILQLICDFADNERDPRDVVQEHRDSHLVEATKTQGLPIRNIRAFTFDAAKN